MNKINTLIKWPGGKMREIKYIKNLIPDYDRYIEPFFGGGAMFFYLKPDKAIINDISKDLTDFYSLVKEQNKSFYNYLMDYHKLFQSIFFVCDNYYNTILDLYMHLKLGQISETNLPKKISEIIVFILKEIKKNKADKIILDMKAFEEKLSFYIIDKMSRTVNNEKKSPFNDSDLKENLSTGFTSGTYMYFRDVYNGILLGKIKSTDKEYNSANFYFIREYCYGSMFRFNRMGEFNIPYGGMSYNRKDFKAKIDNIFSEQTKKQFANTEIHCSDFEEFISSIKLTENDFMFLDPPYDTDFSDYEGKDFTKNDQCRLAEALKNTKAKFILIIKNTDFIYSLYEKHFNILCFDKTYSYNVRSRNNRNVKHLIITNLTIGGEADNYIFKQIPSQTHP